MEQPGTFLSHAWFKKFKIIFLILACIIGLWMIVWPVTMFFEDFTLNLNRISSMVSGIAMIFSAIAIIAKYQKIIVGLVYSTLITIALLLIAISPEEVMLPKMFVWITSALWIVWLVFVSWMTYRHYMKPRRIVQD